MPKRIQLLISAQEIGQTESHTKAHHITTQHKGAGREEKEQFILIHSFQLMNLRLMHCRGPFTPFTNNTKGWCCSPSTGGSSRARHRGVEAPNRAPRRRRPSPAHRTKRTPWGRRASTAGPSLPRGGGSAGGSPTAAAVPMTTNSPHSRDNYKISFQLERYHRQDGGDSVRVLLSRSQGCKCKRTLTW